MRKTLRALMLAAGIAFALFAVALIALNLYVQSVGAQGRIQQELSQRLGLPVHIHSVSITPWGGLTLRGITVTDAEHPATNFISAKAFELHGSTASLFSGSLVIRKVSLVHPFVTWPQDQNGRWRLPGSAQTKESSMVQGDAAAKATPPLLEKAPESSLPSSPPPAQPESTPALAASVPAQEAPKIVKRITPDVERVAISDGTFRFLDNKNILVAGFDGVNLQASLEEEMSLRGVVHIDRLSARDRFFLQNIRSSVKYAENSFELPRISAKAAGGDVNGSFSLQPQSEKSPFHASVHFRGLRADDIVSDAGGGRGVVKGELDGSLELTGPTADVSDLSGAGEITLYHGELQQYSILVALGQVLQIEELTQLHLDQAEAKYHIKDGNVTIDALTLRSPNLRLSATGTVALNGKLHLNAQLAINEKVKSQLFRPIRENFQPTEEPGYSAVDFQIAGTLDRPRTNLVERVVGKNLRDIMNGFLGGKKSDKSKKHGAREASPSPENESTPAESAAPSSTASPSP